MLKEANRTPNLRRRFFLENIETVQSLMKRGDYLKDIHTEVFASSEMSYSQFARYVQKYIKGVAPAKRTPPQNIKSLSEFSLDELKSHLRNDAKLQKSNKPFLENRDEIY